MTTLNPAPSLETLSTDVHVSIAQFMEPYPDMHALSMTCAGLRAVYQPLKWRYSMVTTKFPPQKYGRYMTVPLKVVVPRPNKYSWFHAHEVHTLELDGLNLEDIQGSVEVLGKKWFVDKYYPELRRLQSSLTASSALLMQVPPKTPMFNPIFVGLDSTVGDGEIYINSKRMCSKDDQGMQRLVGSLLQRIVSGSIMDNNVYSPALRVDFVTGRIIDFGYLQSVVVDVRPPMIPLLKMLFDAENTPVNFPNLEEIHLQCDTVFIYDEMRVNSALQFLEFRKLPSSVLTCHLCLNFYPPYSNHNDFLVIPDTRLNRDVHPHVDLPVTSFSYLLSHDPSRFFTRYRLPYLISYQFATDLGHFSSETLTKNYQNQITSVSFWLNAEDFQVCLNALQLIDSMKNLTKIQVKLDWFPTKECFLLSGIMFCVRKLSDDEQIGLMKINEISEELIDMCTKVLIEMGSRIYGQNKDNFPVDCAKSICTTVLNAIYDPSNLDAKITERDEGFFPFKDLLKSFNEALDQVKSTELFYDTIARNLNSLEYVSIQNTRIFQCLPYSPRLHLMCRGIPATGIKQVLISLHTFDEFLNQCFSYHENLDPEVQFTTPTDIFKLVVQVPNMLFFSMPVNFSDNRYQRLEGIVDVENAKKIKRWDPTLKKINMTMMDNRNLFMVDTLLRTQFDGWV
ncbi:uncharacterized protein SAPINGB_P006107 [Magnusiomyces paraingens]|uniref:Uncharacterized protein n=1 Tax=Magnusiomyces paraingens TaxID=2606893 RepID=A0A5E8C5A1_9ASCO|nr:uncharacterized protein SAPINGB_P006107 [Saprochaete ingens]VVT58240.1 unnamed protein product [Saprochaete ingens]